MEGAGGPRERSRAKRGHHPLDRCRARLVPGLVSPWPSQEESPMRKLLLAVVCLMFITGLAVATDVVVVKLDGKNLTVKEGDKEKTYKLTDKTKVTIVGKDGNTEGKLET